LRARGEWTEFYMHPAGPTEGGKHKTLFTVWVAFNSKYPLLNV